MVADPLTSFSVACNVLQIIDFGVKALRKAADYRKDEAGALKEQKDLRNILENLSNLNTHLLGSLAEQEASNKYTVEELRLREANNQCLRLSKELIDFLDSLKLRDRNQLF